MILVKNVVMRWMAIGTPWQWLATLKCMPITFAIVSSCRTANGLLIVESTRLFFTIMTSSEKLPQNKAFSMHSSDGLGCDYGNNWNSIHYGKKRVSHIRIQVRLFVHSHHFSFVPAWIHTLLLPPIPAVAVMMLLLNWTALDQLTSKRNTGASNGFSFPPPWLELSFLLVYCLCCNE